jgi:vanadium chloroperoxidase
LFVSDELDGISFNALGQTRPLVVRSYLKGGLWGAIMDDALSRVFLGVHWVFDCYATADPISPANVGTAPPDMDAFVGGVPLGTSIAENIFAVNGIAPAFTGTPAPQDPFEAAVAPASAAQGLGSEAVPTSTFHGVVDTFL